MRNRNEIVVRVDRAALIITRLSSGEAFEVLFDQADAELVASRPWRVSSSRTAYSRWLYAVTSVPVPGGQKVLAMHRLIAAAPVGMYVDHINRNTLDNRRANLRIVDATGNMLNRRCQPHTASGVRGVHKNGKKWQAMIQFRGKNIIAGRFDTIEEAKAAWDAKFDEIAALGGLTHG